MPPSKRKSIVNSRERLEQFKRKNPESTLSNLEIRILELCSEDRIETLHDLAEAINSELGLDEDERIISRFELSAWISHKNGKSPISGNGSLYEISELYDAGMLYLNIQEGMQQSNRRAMYFLDYLSHAEGIINGFGYQKRGFLNDLANEMDVHRVYLTALSGLARKMLLPALESDSGSRKEYLKAARRLGQSKMEIYLGKTAERNRELKETAEKLSYVGTLKKLGALGMPSAWQSDLYWETRDLLKRYFGKDEYHPMEVRFLDLFRRGKSMGHIAGELHLNESEAKVMKNLLLYGRPDTRKSLVKSRA